MCSLQQCTAISTNLKTWYVYITSYCKLCSCKFCLEVVANGLHLIYFSNGAWNVCHSKKFGVLFLTVSFSIATSLIFQCSGRSPGVSSLNFLSVKSFFTLFSCRLLTAPLLNFLGSGLTLAYYIRTRKLQIRIFSCWLCCNMKLLMYTSLCSW